MSELTPEEVDAALADLDDLDAGLVVTLLPESQQHRIALRVSRLIGTAAELQSAKVLEYARLLVVDLATHVRALRDECK